MRVKDLHSGLLLHAELWGADVLKMTCARDKNSIEEKDLH